MNTSLASKIKILQERARMLAQVRAFFAKRHVLEVDVPMLSHAAPIDTHIDVMAVESAKAYLHTSPEYAMKRLLSQGIGDIYQLCHVFRAEEAGRLHNPEFTMIEWYRVGISFQELIDETLDLIRLFLGDVFVHTYTFAEAVEKFAPSTSHSDFDYLMAFVIEPQLKGLNIIYHFPAEQAALAQITPDGYAERFEIYFNGIELANGFHELTDPIEQRERLVHANSERQKIGKQVLPIDEKFLAALEQGLPDSCGVAVGFDRLLMLKLNKESLSEVLPFAWDNI